MISQLPYYFYTENCFLLKKIFSYLTEHFRQDFQWPLYGYVSVFLTISIAINYSLDFENQILDKHAGRPIVFLHQFLFHGFAYYLVALPQAFFTNNRQRLQNREFWVKSLVFIGLISLYGGFYFHIQYAYTFETYPEQYFVIKVLNELKRLVIYMVPFLVLYYYYDRNEGAGIFGLTWQRFDPKPYLIMLLVMAPIIAMVSFEPSFLKAYPRYKSWLYDGTFGLSAWQLSLIYELVYGFDFLFVEWVYRGALVVGMARVMGKDAILPMVAAYAYLHFGKPLGETIGSVFGSYLLGVIALYSRNILGGVFIHMGIAYLMEIAAFLQHFYRNS